MLVLVKPPRSWTAGKGNPHECTCNDTHSTGGPLLRRADREEGGHGRNRRDPVRLCDRTSDRQSADLFAECRPDQSLCSVPAQSVERGGAVDCAVGAAGGGDPAHHGSGPTLGTGAGGAAGVLREER